MAMQHVANTAAEQGKTYVLLDGFNCMCAAYVVFERTETVAENVMGN